MKINDFIKSVSIMTALAPEQFGFRPGRGCWDAAMHIRLRLRKPSYVLDADISKSSTGSHTTPSSRPSLARPASSRRFVAYSRQGYYD
jgi:hypothetical protein